MPSDGSSMLCGCSADEVCGWHTAENCVRINQIMRAVRAGCVSIPERDAGLLLEEIDALRSQLEAVTRELDDARKAIRVVTARIEDQSRMNSMSCDGGCIDAPCHHGLCRSAVRAMCDELRTYAGRPTGGEEEP